MESGGNSAPNDILASGSKRSFSDVGDEENDNDGSKKVCTKVEAAEMILSLQERLQECRDYLVSFQNEIAACQNKLDSAKAEFEADKSELNKWKSAFEKESFLPARTSPEPGFVIDYIEKLRSSEATLKEQLEIAQMKLAIHDLKAQLKAAPMQRFKTNRDPEDESKQESTAVAGPSHKVAHLKEAGVDKNDGGTSSHLASLGELDLDDIEGAKKLITLIAEMKEVQSARLMEMAKTQSEREARLIETEKALAERAALLVELEKDLAESNKYYGRVEKFLLTKFPSLVPPSASEGTDE